MASWTTADFLSSVRQRGNIPTTTNSANVNNSTNLLNLATEELHIKLLPLIMSVREEFYATHKDHSITANQAAYSIPSRASGMALRDVQIIEGTSIRSLPPVDPEQISTTSTGSVEGYYLQHNSVVLYPTPNATSGTLRLRYFLRPSRLAQTSACAQITAINTGTSTVTVSAVPGSWSTSTPLDLISANAPFQPWAIDQSPTGTTSTTITFSSLPSDLAVGDWLALADYTPIPQVPFEFQPVLAQMTAMKALEANGDREGAKAAEKDLELLSMNALRLISPRNKGENKKVVARAWRR
jgi:hypothetical protein